MAVAIPFGAIILLNTERHLRNACFLRYCQNSFGIIDQIHLDDSFLRKFMKLFLHVSETIHPSSSFCIHIEREDILSYLTSCKYRCLFPLFLADPVREGSPQKKLRKFGHMSELGLPYLPSSLVWTKKSLDKYSYCLPYLPIQKVWTFFNWSLSLNVYFLTFVRILLVNNHARYHQGYFKWRISLGMT